MMATHATALPKEFRAGTLQEGDRGTDSLLCASYLQLMLRITLRCRRAARSTGVFEAGNYRRITVFECPVQCRFSSIAPLIDACAGFQEEIDEAHILRFGCDGQHER